MHEDIKEIKMDRRDKWAKADSQMASFLKASTIQWILGILIVIASAAFGLLWRGQSMNAEKFAETHKRITVQTQEVKQEIQDLAKDMQKDIQDLTKIVIRMEARHERNGDDVYERTRRSGVPDRR